MLSRGSLVFGDLLQLYASLFIWNQIFIAVRAANVSNKIFLCFLIGKGSNYFLSFYCLIKVLSPLKTITDCFMRKCIQF